MTRNQMTLSLQHDATFERHRKTTRRDVFLAEMDQVVPWSDLCACIEPFYPKVRERGGRPPVGVERMLRIHFLQQWYALSDPAVEEALYDSQAMRRFVGIDLGCEGAPDETTVCKFRHLLEKHGLADALFAAVGEHLKKHGMKLSKGTIVDATIIAAPPSTKNKGKARDPDMHQTKKGNQWHFWMKAHIGVDERTGLVHHVTSTAANVGDVTPVPHLLHGKEKHVFGDAGYLGAQKRAPQRGRRFWIVVTGSGSLSGPNLSPGSETQPIGCGRVRCQERQRPTVVGLCLVRVMSTIPDAPLTARRPSVAGREGRK